MNSEIKKEFLDRVRKARNRLVMSEFIRIANSDLYDYQEMRRAVLKEIAFLQVNDENTKVPEESPFKGQYTGWCYASQRFLAARVGCREDYVQKCVTLFEDDGVIEVRRWNDAHGYPHTEYHVLEDVVTAHQRPEGYLNQERKRPQSGGNKVANKGSFKKGNTAALKQKPPATSAVATLSDSRMPSATSAVMPPAWSAVEAPAFAAVLETAEVASKEVIGLGGCAAVASLPTHSGSFDLAGATTARVQASAASAFGGAGRESGEGIVPPRPNQNPRPTNGSMAKGKKPLPNRLCYPEAFKNWKPGIRVPKCHRCQELLHPNENHVCEGYEPQHPELDIEGRQANAMALRDDRMAQGKDCRQELHDEQDILSAYGAEEIQ